MLARDRSPACRSFFLGVSILLPTPPSFLAVCAVIVSGPLSPHAVSVVIVATKLVVCGVFLLLTPLLQPGVLGEHSIPAVIGLLNVILLAQQRRGVSLARFFLSMPLPRSSRGRAEYVS